MNSVKVLTALADACIKSELSDEETYAIISHADLEVIRQYNERKDRVERLKSIIAYCRDKHNRGYSDDE